MNYNIKITMICIVFILSVTSLFTQLQGQEKIDSLLNELPKAKEDTNKVRILQMLSYQYHTIDHEKGIQFGKQGLELASKLNFNDGMAGCYNNLGTNYRVQSDYKKSLEYYLKSLKILNRLKNEENKAGVLNNIGIIYRRLSKYDEALRYYKQALEINKILNNKKRIAYNLGNLSNIYSKMNDHEKSLIYLKDAIHEFEKLGDKYALCISYNNLGKSYAETYDFSNALNAYNKSIKISKEIGDKGNLSLSYLSLGKVYFDLTKDTIQYKLKELKLNLELDKMLNFNNALRYTKMSEILALQLGDNELLLNIYNNFNEIYRDMDNFKNAYEFQGKWAALRDSIFSVEKEKQIANLEAKRENEIKDKQLKVQQLQLLRNRNERWALIGGISLLSLIVYLIYYQRKKSEDLLLNILPAPIAKRLKKKEKVIADSYNKGAVAFIDIVNFTSFSKDKTPAEVVKLLNKLFSKFDDIARKYDLEKIKTIGDAYMVASGVPLSNDKYAENMLNFAIDVKNLLENYQLDDGVKLDYRMGIESGELAAGVIGKYKFTYDIWGDTVNMASRMESTSEVNKIQIGENFKQEIDKLQINDKIRFESRKKIEIKGKGKMNTYFLEPGNVNS